MYIAYKHIGETPLACVRRVFPPGKKYTYAGRLDPMAEGLLLILGGEECAGASRFYGLEKVYAYSFILGIGTDSYDRLGRIVATASVPDGIAGTVRETVREFRGDITLPYPPYSSKTADGKPLFEHARRNTPRDEYTTPERVMRIYDHTLLRTETVPSATVSAESVKRIGTVRGDFRQNDCIAGWNALPDGMLPVFSAVMRCGGGTYVRAVVHAMGERIGCPAVCTDIRRTRIGPWDESCLDGGDVARVSGRSAG